MQRCERDRREQAEHAGERVHAGFLRELDGGRVQRHQRAGDDGERPSSDTPAHSRERSGGNRARDRREAAEAGLTVAEYVDPVVQDAVVQRRVLVLRRPVDHRVKWEARGAPGPRLIEPDALVGDAVHAEGQGGKAND